MSLRGEYINALVALSNIFGLPLFFLSMTWTFTVICFYMIIFSVLMHLSDRKHNLPGIYPFNKLTTVFLWCDRIMAYICSLVIIYYMYINWTTTSSSLIYYGLFGLFSMIISELIIDNQWIAFAVFHSIWHFVAYSLFYVVMSHSKI